MSERWTSVVQCPVAAGRLHLPVTEGQKYLTAVSDTSRWDQRYTRCTCVNNGDDDMYEDGGRGVVAGKATQSTGIEPYYLMLWLCKSKGRAQKWSSKTLKLVIPYSKKKQTQQAFNCQPMTSPAWFNNSSSQQIFGDLYTLTHKHTRICTCDVSPLWL